jgi:NADP-dependent aldehyde dehydrogenase
MPVDLIGQSIIGYRRGGKGGAELRGIDPATGESLSPAYYSASRAELNDAAQLAARSFPVYSHLSGKERGAFLRRIAENLEALGDPLLERASRESGLPMARMKFERGRTCSQLRFFAEIIEEGSWVDARIDVGDATRHPAPKPDVRSLRRPLGPVAIFCASNFPLAFSVPGGDTVSALASGNPVVVLAHYSHPGSAELAGMAIRNAASECGLPEGVFSLLYDAGQEIAQALVSHPEITGVGFTGSRRGGTALLKIANSRPSPIPFYAEMGSVNPVFILPGALQSRTEAIAKGLHAAVTLGVGQFCTNPGVIVTSGEDAPFASQLAERMSGTAVGVMLNRGIATTYQRGISERASHPNIAARAVVATPSGEGKSPCGATAALFSTDAKTWVADHTLQDEIFGPSTLLVHATTREEIFEVARQLEGNLTATIHGTDDDLREFADLIALLETKVGRIIFNGYPTGVEVCQAMVHGGPFPATSDGRSTSVGGRAILRFTRFVCFQDFTQSALPAELQDANPLGIWRLVDGKQVQSKIAGG